MVVRKPSGPLKPLTSSSNAHTKPYANILNTQRVGDGEPAANIVITRGAGTVPALPSLKSRNDLRGACIAGTAMIKGLALAAGLDLVDVKGATGGWTPEYEEKKKKKKRKGKRKKVHPPHNQNPQTPRA